MKRLKEYIAYEGGKFSIEWYYDQNGKSKSLDYYCSLPDSDRMKVLQFFKRFADAGEIKDKTKFNYEGDQIYSFKPQPERFLCFFFRGNKIVVTNAFRKKQDKLPMNEKKRALQYKGDYESRVKGGNYYE